MNQKQKLHKSHSKASNLQPFSRSELEKICGGGVDPETNPPPDNPGKHNK